MKFFPRAILREGLVTVAAFLWLGCLCSWAQTNAAPQSVTNNSVSAAPSAHAPTQQQADAEGASADDKKPDQSELRISAGDLLQIKVFGAAELDQDARVSSRGEIIMPLLGAVHVGGLTDYDAQALIEGKLRQAGLMKDPHVTVLTKEYSTQGITVLGEVQKPGIYPLLGSRRLYDVISAAGGTTPKAGRKIKIVHRNQPDTPTELDIDSDPSTSTPANVAIMPGDTIVVSRAGIVYVVGDVAHPSGFIMDNNGNLTVLQAIAMAGGTNGTAALDKARIIRKTDSGRQELPMPLKQILAAKSEDVPLQADDILFVPNSRAKGVAKRGIESILQITTGLAISGRY
jgi:polysaccharide biosynthesis/export protein